MADSVNPVGCRLTAFLVVVPKWMLAELNTHRMLSRSAASSRAIPVKKVIGEILKNPYVPVRFGANQSGMQASADLKGWRLWAARKLWLWARLPAVLFTLLLLKVGLHKQWANRVLEPWMWATVVVSGTDWTNFFRLRANGAALPDFQLVADLMLEAYLNNSPRKVNAGEWHLPFADRFLPDDAAVSAKKVVSTARCARTSYENHLGGYDYSEDERLFGKLTGDPPHAVPLEHPAEALADDSRVGNYRGWKQFRKELANEDGNDTDLGQLLAQRLAAREGRLG